MYLYSKGVILLRKAKVSAELKLEAVKAYLSGHISIKNICKRYGVVESSVERWVRNYKSMGETAFFKPHNKHYPKELKLLAVKEYLAGKGSLDALAKKYKIFSESTLKNWILVYNGHKEFKGQNCSGGKLMTKGRKTTYEERLEIVADCIGSGNDYNAIAEKYGVSYQQVYTWTAKFKEKGADGLVDRRGKAKDVDELTEIDRLKAENKRLEAEKQALQMELDIIKKLRELKERCRFPK